MLLAAYDGEWARFFCFWVGEEEASSLSSCPALSGIGDSNRIDFTLQS